MQRMKSFLMPTHQKISSNMQHIINPVYYQDFILSGKPEFTLKSLETGNEEIFVVKRKEDFYYVNNRVREGFGLLKMLPDAHENVWIFDKMRKLMGYQIKQAEIFEWFWNACILRPYEMRLLQKIQLINHTGRCGRCHRPLDDPDSMVIGIGPDCFKKLNLTYKTLIKL